MQNVCIECGKVFEARSAKHTVCSKECFKARRRKLQRHARDQKRELEKRVEEDYLSPEPKIKNHKIKVIKSPEHEEAVNSHIRYAEKHADVVMRDIEGKTEREMKYLWTLEYLNEMNRLTANAGLRIAF